MKKNILRLVLVASVCRALVPTQYPTYTVDFDEPAATRYNKMFEDFKEPLLEMEQYWYGIIPEYARSIIRDNMD
jgi:hypothetical protein